MAPLLRRHSITDSWQIQDKGSDDGLFIANPVTKLRRSAMGNVATLGPRRRTSAIGLHWLARFAGPRQLRKEEASGNRPEGSALRSR